MTLQSKRDCHGCTACCEGWLTGAAHGHSFYPGKPCHFLTLGGCSIYNDRPENPCKTFDCAWKLDQEFIFPEWMKPSMSGVVMKFETWAEDQHYLEVYEMGKKIDAVVLNWLIMKSLQDNKNIGIQIDGGWYYYGSQDFIAAKTRNG